MSERQASEPAADPEPVAAAEAEQEAERKPSGQWTAVRRDLHAGPASLPTSTPGRRRGNRVDLFSTRRFLRSGSHSTACFRSSRGPLVSAGPPRDAG